MGSAEPSPTHVLTKKSVEKGGDNYDQRNSKNRHNGNYNGFTNYYFVVIGY